MYSGGGGVQYDRFSSTGAGSGQVQEWSEWESDYSIPTPALAARDPDCSILTPVLREHSHAEHRARADSGRDRSWSDPPLAWLPVLVGH